MPTMKTVTLDVASRRDVTHRAFEAFRRKKQRARIASRRPNCCGKSSLPSDGNSSKRWPAEDHSQSARSRGMSGVTQPRLARMCGP